MGIIYAIFVFLRGDLRLRPDYFANPAVQGNFVSGGTLSTVREHYDVTARALNACREWHLSKGEDFPPVIVLGKISYMQEENAKYWSFYIPPKADLSCIEYLLQQKNVAECYIQEGEPEQIIGFADTPERQSLSSFVFTGRIYLYIDEIINESTRADIIRLGERYRFYVRIRDQNYVKECAELSRPLAFISHDSRDKDSLVRELAIELNKILCPVWYDEFSLKVGDSLRANIEKGLKESKKCIVVLSPNFLSNNGWGKAEFDSIYTREIIERNNVFLPIWHNVGVHDVYDYSPRLADKVGLNSAEGIPALAKKLAAVIKDT